MTQLRTFTTTSPWVAWRALMPAWRRMMTRKLRMELMPVVCVSASTMQASTKGTTYLRRQSESCVAGIGGDLLLARHVFHFLPDDVGFLLGQSAEQRCAGLRDAAFAKEPARGFAEEEAGGEKENARIDDGEEHAAPRVVLRGQHQRGVAGGVRDGGFGLAGVEQANEGRQHDAEGER